MSKKGFNPRRKEAKLRVKNLSRKWKKRTKVSRASNAWKLLRRIISILCLTLFFYQSEEFLRVYYKYPTTTKIEFTHPDEFEIPAITFCSGNPVKRSKFCGEFPDLCESPDNITELCKLYPYECKDNPSDLLIPKLGYFANASHDEILQKILQIYWKGNITKEFWGEWAWTIIEFRRDDKMKPVFEQNMGVYLPCYTEDLLLNSTDEPKKFNLDSRYGQRSFRTYDLNIQRSEALAVGSEPYVVLSIHSPFVPEDPFVQGSHLKLGYKYKIYIKLEEEILLPYPYDTDCINYEELWSENSRQTPRSKEMCKELCMHELFKRNKNVTPEFQLMEYPLELCFGRGCLTSIEDKAALELCRNDCKASCRILKYKPTVIETILDSSKKEIRDFDSERDKIEIEIFIQDRQVVVEKHFPLYDTGHLFSYIGGLMGCWLGVSIWAFPGIAENVFRRAIPWIENIKRHFKETSPTKHTIFSPRRSNVLNIKII